MVDGVECSDLVGRTIQNIFLCLPLPRVRIISRLSLLVSNVVHDLVLTLARRLVARQYNLQKQNCRKECDFILDRGCILFLKLIFLPPPLLSYMKFIIRRACTLQAKNVQLFSAFNCWFLLQFLCVNMHTFLPINKYAFPPFFSSPFNHSLPRHVIWPYFCPFPPPAGIYTPLEINIIHII